MGHSNYGFQNTHISDMQELTWKKKKPAVHMKHWCIWTSDVFIYRL